MDLSALPPLAALRQSIVRSIEETGGRHDEPEIYSASPGDPGLTGGPTSMSWQLHGDMASVLLAGLGAVIMEVLHPSVIAGVDSGTYRTQPERRARNTLGYVLRTTFGTTEAATHLIEQVKRIHSRVEGTRPDGVPYRALDPELIAWVHTSIPWSIMTAYERTNRPLSTLEKDQYLTEQAVIGRMGGAEWVPETVAELESYVEDMRPRLAVNAQTREFLDFLCGDVSVEPLSRAVRFDARQNVALSMALQPRWAQRMTGTERPAWDRRLRLGPLLRVDAAALRWAIPEPTCKRLALARVAAATDEATTPAAA